MILKPGKERDELCYPFIYESSWLCDYEVCTDELCAQIGAILAEMPNEFEDLRSDLEQLQPFAFHLNGSIRGQVAISEGDITWLHNCLRRYKAEVTGGIDGFILPRGERPVPQIHMARSSAKKAIRLMVRIDQEGIQVPDCLPRFCNLMCNFFFILTLVINQRVGVAEVPFDSLSYGPSAR